MLVFKQNLSRRRSSVPAQLIVGEGGVRAELSDVLNRVLDDVTPKKVWLVTYN